jgi:hypothetical protein
MAEGNIKELFEAVRQGKCQEVEDMLARPFALDADVTMEVRTMNLSPFHVTARRVDSVA